MQERRLGWGLVAPALAFTTLFFVLAFLAMAAVSLSSHETGGVSFGNYAEFVLNPSYRQAMVNSLEVTIIVTAISIMLAYPFAWILAEQVPPRWQRLALLLAILPFWT